MCTWRLPITKRSSHLSSRFWLLHIRTLTRFRTTEWSLSILVTLQGVWQLLSISSRLASGKLTMQVRVSGTLWDTTSRRWLTPAGQRYREFGEDIRNLAINLDLLFDVLQRARYQAGTSERTSRYISPVFGSDTPASQQVLGNFRETIDACGHMLNDQTYFQKCDGFVSSIYRYDQIDPEVQRLRERIAFHNIKVLTFSTNSWRYDFVNSLVSYRFLSKSWIRELSFHQPL